MMMYTSGWPKIQQVLPKQWIGAGLRIEELGAEQPVEHQQEQRHRDDRDGEEQQELRDQQHPREDGHAEHGHARRPHVEHRDDQVDRTDERGDAGDLQTEDIEVDSVGRRERETAVGRVAEPPAVGATTADDP
jgi:hypothetical protein